jgi:hypothetical protein
MMSNRHKERALTFRPAAEIRDPAQSALDEREREIGAFLTACLAALNHDPDGFLGQLDAHWPPAKPRGRPRRAGAE